jgi:deazaflavin-dependent oxidoreductase (nitroreductase family)
MAFDTRNGTRGARQPGGFFLKFANRMMARRVRRGSPGDLIVLVTTGRRSGAERESPLRAFPGPDGAWDIVAAAAGGPRNPAWYYNLAAHPRASVITGGRTVPVEAVQLHGAERDEAWQRITTAASRFADYQVKTDRELPVIRLTPA